MARKLEMSFGVPSCYLLSIEPLLESITNFPVKHLNHPLTLIYCVYIFDEHSKSGEDVNLLFLKDNF